MSGDSLSTHAQPSADKKGQSVLNLPAEVLLSFDISQHDALALCKVNQHFHKVFVQKLYSSVRIPESMWEGFKPAVVCFLRTIVSVPQLAAYVKKLRLVEGRTWFPHDRTFKVDQSNALVPCGYSTGTPTGPCARIKYTDLTSFLLSNLPNLVDLTLRKANPACWSDTILYQLRSIDIAEYSIDFADLAKILHLPVLEKLSMAGIKGGERNPALLQHLRRVPPRSCKVQHLYIEELVCRTPMPADIFKAFLTLFGCLKRFRWFRHKHLSPAWSLVLAQALSHFKTSLNTLAVDVSYPVSLQVQEGIHRPLLDLRDFTKLQWLHVTPDLLIRTFVPVPRGFWHPIHNRVVGEYQPLTLMSDTLPSSISKLVLQGNHVHFSNSPGRGGQSTMDHAPDFWFNLVRDILANQTKLPALEVLEVATLRMAGSKDCRRCYFKETKEGCYLHHRTAMSDAICEACRAAGIQLLGLPGTPAARQELAAYRSRYMRSEFWKNCIG